MSSLAVSAVKRFASIGVSIGLLALLAFSMMAKTDWEHVSRTLLTIDPIWLGAAILVLWLNFPLNTHRFALVVGWLTGQRPAFAATFKITWVGSFVSMCAPFAALGDVARAGMVHWVMKLSLGHAAQAVLFDRGLSMLGLMMIGLAATLWQFDLTLPEHFAMTQIGVMAACLSGMALVMLGHRFIPWPMNRIGNFLKSCCMTLVTIVGQPKRLAVQLLLAGCNVLTYTGCMYCLSRGMGIELALVSLMMLAPLVLLISNLPIFYMGWGGREATMLLLAAAILPHEVPSTMLALSLAYGVATIITILPGGLFLIGLQPQEKNQQIKGV